MIIISFLAVFVLAVGACASVVVLWRANQSLSRELVRVVGKSAISHHAVVQEVSPKQKPKTEDQLTAERDKLKTRQALWRR
jgi:hypothetical protein|tara:strand:+ start:2097 stop:2339 length:243 start_codon:yes stop_codon:yes gene_type:complete